ncbi:MAG: hypothetical protein KatS3mg032_0259 [Cyclobacteriaceae bacterium]|nr:MAG: hypothetical protein KatS3mg032_0259 [Cyclobacteriaceae bacterium]
MLCFSVVAAGILPAVSVLAQPHRPAPGPPAAPAPKKPDPHGLTLLLGPAVYYYQGDPNSAIERFNESRIGYQVNGMLGYKGPEHRGGNTLGVFGTAGYTTESVFNYIKEYQGLTTDDLVINKYFTFYQVEAGFIISNILRFSTGAGKQNFTTINGEESFRYLTSTIGLMINLGPVLWNIDANFNYGRDWPETALRISTGLLVKF